MAADIFYNLGESALLNVSPYAFEQVPAICGYPETVTVTNLPAFATHNLAAKDFSLSQITDLSLIGEYTVTIRSEIEVPDDYTLSSATTFFDEYQFKIYV